MVADSSHNGAGARRIADDSEPRSSGTPRRAAQRGGSAHMGGTMAWTIVGTIIPGVGLWRSGRRVAGSLALAVAIIVAGGLAYVAVSPDRNRLVAAVTPHPEMLYGGAIALLLLALGWVLVIGATHLTLRPQGASAGQRFAGAALVGVLSFAVAAPLAYGANIAYTSASAVQTIFDKNNQSVTIPTFANNVDPWSEKARLNVLILGGDVDAKRGLKNGVRPDTVIVASIDTASGATTLISLPRQTMAMPFPKDSPLHKYYPNGFGAGEDYRNGEFYLNAMYKNVPDQVPDDIIGKTSNLGADVMKISVGEALGLDIDYYVLINMDGFKDLINALGGITVNVNYPVPIGGKTGPPAVKPSGWIPVGANQHLTGRLALWYARGRYGLDDYKRQDRQRCVINAVVKQANPQNLIVNYEKVMSAGEKTILTDVPQDMLPALLDLATRVQGTKLRSVSLVNGKDGFKTASPDWDKVRSRVKAALKETLSSNTEKESPSSTPTASGTPTANSTPTTSTSSKPSSTPTSSSKPRSGDLDDECAYHPE